MLASFLCILTLKDSGTGFPNPTDDLILGIQEFTFVHTVLNAADVLELATSTAVKSLLRSSRREIKAFLIS